MDKMWQFDAFPSVLELGTHAMVQENNLFIVLFLDEYIKGYRQRTGPKL